MDPYSMIGGWHEALPPICKHCGYNLTGLMDGSASSLTSNRCPECGAAYFRSELLRTAREMRTALRQTEDINDLVDVGAYVLAGGMAILLVSWVSGIAVPLGRLLGFFTGLGTLGAGLQILRVRRLPAWARPYIQVQPKTAKAVSLIVGGLVLAALAAVLP
jgi:hypothetical protein